MRGYWVREAGLLDYHCWVCQTVPFQKPGIFAPSRLSSMPVQHGKAKTTPSLQFKRRHPDSRGAYVMRKVTRACRTGVHPGQQRCVTPLPFLSSLSDFRTVLAAPEADRLAKFASLVDLDLTSVNSCCMWGMT